MTIQFKASADLKRKLSQAYKKNVADKLRIVGEEISREIVERTQSGRDYAGAGFAAYSEAYAKNRAKGGRSRAPVTLTFTGRMLGSIKSQVQRVGRGFLLRWYIGAEHIDKARGAMFGYGKPGHKKREFFKLSKEQLKKIEHTIKELLISGR